MTPLKSAIASIILVLMVAGQTDAQDKPVVQYAGVIKIANGHTYYVDTGDVLDNTHDRPWRVLHAYSLDGDYATIVAVGEVGTRWTRLSACTKDEAKNSNSCHRSVAAEDLVRELLKKVMLDKNLIEDPEVMKAWNLLTVDLTVQIMMRD